MHACHGLQILDRDRQAAQHPALGHRLRGDLRGIRTRPIEAQGGQGVHRPVHRRHPRLQRVEYLRMGDFTGVQPGQHLAGGHADQVVHLVSPTAPGRPLLTQPSPGASRIR